MKENVFLKLYHKMALEKDMPSTPKALASPVHILNTHTFTWETEETSSLYWLLSPAVAAMLPRTINFVYLFKTSSHTKAHR
jgi:hypothetical protein